MIKDYFTETFTVESASTAKSAIGSWSPVWTEVADIMGFIDRLTGSEQLMGAQYLNRGTHVLGCSSTCSWITTKHRVKDSDDNIYRVLDNDNPVRRNHHREIVLEYNEADNKST